MNIPIGYTALDLVGYTDKGDYAALSAYIQNDLVHYQGDVWRCLIDDTTGVTPAENANWTIFVAKPTGAAEAMIAPIESATAIAAHAVGSQLVYNDTLYEVISAITIGDTLMVGTNIQAADTITEQMANLDTEVGQIRSDLSDYLPRSEQIVLGARNLLPMRFSAIKTINTEGVWSNNIYILNGIRFTLTVSGDIVTKIVADRVSANATRAYLTVSSFADGEFNKFSGCIINGCPAGGSDSTYKLQVQNIGYGTYNDTGSGLTIPTITEGAILINIWIAGDSSPSAQEWYPMIRLASDPSTVFSPYAMTNRELTEVKTLTGASISGTDVTSRYVRLFQCGKIIQAHIGITITSAQSAGADLTITLSGAPLPVEDLSGMTYAGTSVHAYSMSKNGAINFRCLSSTSANFNTDMSFTYITS